MTDLSRGTSSAPTSTPAARPVAGALNQRSLILACLIGVVVSQLHHLRDLAGAGGWSELPTYLITAALSYGLISIGLAVVRRRRRAAAAVALIYAALAFLTFYFTYWTAWPVAAAISACLLARDAGRRPTTVVAIVLAVLTLAAAVAAAVYRAMGGTYQTGS